MEEEGDFYTPAEAERILARTDKPISERRIRQMLSNDELEGYRDERGRWHVARHEVHRLLEERREAPERLPEAPESAAGLFEVVRDLEREIGRLEGRLELTEQAESTIREERDRLLRELEEEREERRRLAERLEELAAARRPWWRRVFGS